MYKNAFQLRSIIIVFYSNSQLLHSLDEQHIVIHSNFVLCIYDYEYYLLCILY